MDAQAQGAVGLQGARVAVIGNSGSGKSTLARALSERLGVAYVELDALNWGPGWLDRSKEAPQTFIAALETALAAPGWVTDGNYSRIALPRILPKVTDVVWLDYSRPVLMTRVIRRSFQRALSREELWPGTGNREVFRRWLDPGHPIRWTWDTFASAREGRSRLFAGKALAHARKHRFATPSQTRAWLATLDLPPGA